MRRRKGFLRLRDAPASVLECYGLDHGSFPHPHERHRQTARRRNLEALRSAASISRCAYLIDRASGRIKLMEYHSATFLIAYLAHGEKVADRRAYRGVRPRRLEIDVNGRRVFEVVWNDEGKRRKVRGEPGSWSERLREEIERLADDER